MSGRPRRIRNATLRHIESSPIYAFDSVGATIELESEDGRLYQVTVPYELAQQIVDARDEHTAPTVVAWV